MSEDNTEVKKIKKTKKKTVKVEYDEKSDGPVEITEEKNEVIWCLNVRNKLRAVMHEI